jgi:hypothetical protein
MKSGTASYPPLINECGQYIGGLRDVVHLGTQSWAKEYNRGNKLVSQLGVKCELIAQYFFWSIGKEYTSNQLVHSKAIVGEDIIVGDKKIDVKGMYCDTQQFRVNYKAHHKDKGISHYMFIRPKSDGLECNEADWWFVPKSNVDKWNVEQLKYTQAYVKQVS